MLVQETHLDVVTNNLANADTLGFRRRIPVNEEFSAHLDRLEKVSEDDERKIVTVPPFTMNWKGKRTIGTLALANVFSEGYRLDMNAPGVCQVKTSFFVERFQVRQMLKKVRIDLSALQSFVGRNVIGKFDNFQLYFRGCQILGDELKHFGMRFGC